MKNINYIVVPSQEDGTLLENAVWKDGKLTMLNEGHGKATIFLDHKSETVCETIGEETVEKEITRAFAVRMDSPVTRDAAINAAEMEAYGLRTAMDVASFNASLARKARLNAEDAEVAEHDTFVGWVKEELDKIGLESADS